MAVEVDRRNESLSAVCRDDAIFTSSLLRSHFIVLAKLSCEVSESFLLIPKKSFDIHFIAAVIIATTSTMVENWCIARIKGFFCGRDQRLGSKS
jgi:hypothetical protein